MQIKSIAEHNTKPLIKKFDINPKDLKISVSLIFGLGLLFALLYGIFYGFIGMLIGTIIGGTMAGIKSEYKMRKEIKNE